MKKFIRVIRWVLGVSIALVGLLLMLGGEIVSGFLLMLAGGCLSPFLGKYIPFLRKKACIVVMPMVLFIASVSLGSGVEESEQVAVSMESEQESEKETTKKAEVKEKEITLEQTTLEATTQPITVQKTTEEPTTEASTTQVKKKENKKELKKLIEDNVYNGEISQEVVTQLKGYSEESFYSVWKQMLLELIESEEVQIGTSDLNDFCIFYQKIWPNSKNIIKLLEHKKGLDSLNAEYNKLNVSSYGFRYDEFYVDSMDFYVTQKLESGYSDNLLGALEKEVDSYKEEDGSNWVAYNTEYDQYIGAIRGENEYILHANYAAPFPKLGSYSVDFVDLGATTSIKDGNGFTRSVPVYQIVDMDVINAEQEALSAKDEELFSAMEKVMSDLGGA